MIKVHKNAACRSAIPVITALLAVVIERQVPTKAEGMGLLVLTSGVMLSVYEGSGGTSRGIMICILGEACCPGCLSEHWPQHSCFPTHAL